MPLRFKQQILSHVRDARYEPVEPTRLADTLGVEEEDLPAFQEAVTAMLGAGTLTRNSRGQIELPPIGGEVIGRFRLHPKGFGFLIPDTLNREGDLFIPPGESLNAVTGDRVRAEVLHGGRRPRDNQSPYVGRIVEVVERARTNYVGTLRRGDRLWYVEPDGKLFHEYIVVRDVGAKNAQDGDKVVVEVIRFPSPGEPADGVIVERLGEAGRPDVETQAVIIGYGLPGEFPKEAVDQARESARRFTPEAVVEELEFREDLRDVFTVTIDPPDARDFDDAITINRLPEGGFELGVHIADVSWFIPESSPLDVEAASRGNSCYLPRHVIPMLPETLSNGVCSLQEGVDRFTMSAFIRFDERGRVQSSRCASTIIRSNKRLTYLEAEALIQGDAVSARQHAMSESPYPDELIPTLQLMSRLANAIRARRMQDGMIVLTLPEVELLFDDQGHVIGAQPEDTASTHGLIEMFMVEANEAVARLFDSLQVPILRRTHPDPSTFDLGELRSFCEVAGVNIPKNPTRHELQSILDWTRGTPRQQAVHLAVLKSLTKAEYSPALIGHFALASSHYAHFTSPIRRYPDLLVHRALAAFLERTRNGRAVPRGQGMKKLGATLRKDPRCPDEDRLVEIGRRCNDTERNAELAESSLRTYLVLRFIEENHLGDIFDGVVVGISSRMLFVQLEHLLVEGAIEIRDLPPPSKLPPRRVVEAASTSRITRAGEYVPPGPRTAGGAGVAESEDVDDAEEPGADEVVAADADDEQVVRRGTPANDDADSRGKKKRRGGSGVRSRAGAPDGPSRGGGSGDLSKGRSGGKREGRWQLNQDTGALIAPGSGASITLGDRFRVQVVIVDPAARRLDLRLVSPDEEARVARQLARGERVVARGASGTVRAASGEPFVQALAAGLDQDDDEDDAGGEGDFDQISSGSDAGSAARSAVGDAPDGLEEPEGTGITRRRLYRNRTSRTSDRSGRGPSAQPAPSGKPDAAPGRGRGAGGAGPAQKKRPKGGGRGRGGKRK